MPDREKVLNALEHHKETAVCNGCPYAEDKDTPQGNCPVYDDAIALLREDGHIQAMRDADPCGDCQEWDCDGCDLITRTQRRKYGWR